MLCALLYVHKTFSRCAAPMLHCSLTIAPSDLHIPVNVTLPSAPKFHTQAQIHFILSTCILRHSVFLTVSSSLAHFKPLPCVEKSQQTCLCERGLVGQNIGLLDFLLCMPSFENQSFPWIPFFRSLPNRQPLVKCLIRLLSTLNSLWPYQWPVWSVKAVVHNSSWGEHATWWPQTFSLMPCLFTGCVAPQKWIASLYSTALSLIEAVFARQGNFLSQQFLLLASAYFYLLIYLKNVFFKERHFTF